jgi:CPA2 family monovalent cation:H+ antiporter-2
MTSSINVHVYSDALVLLGTAGVVIPLVRRFGFNPVLGYLTAGAILGPLGLGSFIDKFPLLYWFTVVDAANVSGLANLGVVFLLFLIGMELSYERLKAMHRLIFGLGTLQIVLSTVVIGFVAALAGTRAPVPLILGACLALSSTAIVMEILGRQKRLNTSAGRASFAVLLAQDLAVVPLLLFITIFGEKKSGSAIETLLFALTNAAVALTTLTMMLTPALSHVARRLAPMVREDKPLDPELTVAPSGGSGHAIVVGHGRVGQVVCTMLDRHQFKYTAVDNDAAAVPEQRRQGRTVFYGDATNPEFLKSCGLMEAAAVIVTISETKGIDEIVAQVRALRKDILIVSRARDADHARHLYSIGVTDAVPETIEASLQVSEAALIGLGVAMGLVVASIHEKREEFRRELQQAAGNTGAVPKHVAGTRRRRLFR